MKSFDEYKDTENINKNVCFDCSAATNVLKCEHSLLFFMCYLNRGNNAQMLECVLEKLTLYTKQ